VHFILLESKRTSSEECWDWIRFLYFTILFWY